MIQILGTVKVYTYQGETLLQVSHHRTYILNMVVICNMFL